MEGASLLQAQRLLTGEPLYAAPSLGFVPLIYGPLYFAVGAAVLAATGPVFAGLRLVSLLATLGSALLVASFVRSETGRTGDGLVAAGLFLATYRLSGAFFDLARVDALFVLSLLGFLALLRFATRPSGLALAGLALALAFLTKQTALLVAAPLLVHAALVRRWRALWVLLPGLAAAGAAILVLQRATHGWFGFYFLELPSTHRLPAARLLAGVPRFVVGSLLKPLPAACLLAAALLVLLLRQRRPADAGFFACAAAGFLGASFLAFVNPGAFDNVLMPAHAVLALMAGVALGRARDAFPVGGASIAAACLAGGQILLLAYRPGPLVPSERDRLAGDRLVRLLSGIPGEVLIPSSPYLAVRAGKRPSFHMVAASELLGGFGGAVPPAGRSFSEDLSSAIRAHRFRAVVSDTLYDPWWRSVLAGSYEPRGRAIADPEALWPVTGGRIRPHLVYLSSAPAGAVR